MGHLGHVGHRRAHAHHLRVGEEHVAGVGAPGVHLGLLPGLPRLVLGFHRFLHLDGPQLEGGVAEGGRVVLAAPGDMPGLRVTK